MNENTNPGGGQVPQHRFQEVMETMRKMEQQNQQLRQTVDQLMLRQNPPQEATVEKPLFQPEVDQALEKKIRGMLEPETNKLKNHLGFLVDRNDELEFRQKWGTEKFEAYNDKIEALRNDATRRGQFLRREDAYKHIFFEENGKKPQPKPEAPKGPSFDPYTQQYVQETPVVPQEIPAIAPQVPVPMQVPAAPVDTEVVLPPVGPINASTSVQPQRGQIGIELNSDDKALDSWANKYENQPL